MQKLKDENNLLTRRVKELDDRLYALKRSGGCGPGCGRNGTTGANATQATAGEAAESSALSSSSSGSPTAPVRATGGVSGSAGVAYNLRRRGKTVEGVAAAAGKRTGLRDMTNAN